MAEKKYFDRLTKLEFCELISQQFQADYEVKDSVCELEPCEVVIPRTGSLKPSPPLDDARLGRRFVI